MPALYWVIAVLLLVTCAKAHDSGGTLSGTYFEVTWASTWTPIGTPSAGMQTYAYSLSGSRSDFPAATICAHVTHSGGTVIHLDGSGTFQVPAGEDFLVQIGNLIPPTLGHGHPNEIGTTWGVGSGAYFTAAAGTNCTFSVNITNSSGVAVWYRAVHSVDGVLGTSLLQPGETWTQEWEVTCDGTGQVQYQPASGQGNNNSDGVWFVPDEDTPPNPDDNPADPDQWDPATEEIPVENVTPPVEQVTQTTTNPLPPARNVPRSAPWVQRPPNAETTNENLLDRDTFREGITKLTDLLQEDKSTAEIPIDTEPIDEPDAEGNTEPKTAAEYYAATSNVVDLIGTLTVTTTGSMTEITSISATIPQITVMGATWPEYVWNFNIASQAVAIGIMRNLLACAITILFFLKVVDTIRNSSA